MAEAKQTLIEIRDFDGDAIEDLVKFVYSSRLTLTVDNVQPLLYAACILQVELVAKACCEYMKLHFHPSNCLAVRAFAESHNRIDLMDMADQYACEHFTEVVECEDFVSVSPQHLHKLLSSSDLNIENEKQVYNAAIKWLLANPQHHATWLDEILAQVRLPLLPICFLMGVVAKEEIVKQNLKCRDLLDEARNYHLHLSSRAVPDFEYSIRTTPRKQTAGVLFCVGGRGGSGDPFRSIECYSISKNNWFFGPEMNSRRRHVGVISVGGKVYAVGGHDGNEHLGSMEVFDPLTNKWMMKASMNTKRRGIALASLGGPIYAIGGLDDNTCFSDVERYDIDSDRWSAVAPMNTPRGGVGSVALVNHVYAVGGNDGVASLSSVEKYDPHLDKWIEVKEMGQRRAGNGVSELHGCLYVVECNSQQEVFVSRENPVLQPRAVPLCYCPCPHARMWSPLWYFWLFIWLGGVERRGAGSFSGTKQVLLWMSWLTRKLKRKKKKYWQQDNDDKVTSPRLREQSSPPWFPVVRQPSSGSRP
ncbi:kelch-like protein 8 isoform X6 [Ciconia boyciana]